MTLPSTSAPGGPKPGDEAPDFELKDQHGQTVRLRDFRGQRNVVLVFYPAAFTPTCTGELTELRAERGRLADDDVAVLGISCDPLPALRVFAERQGIEFPLLADFWPHGEVARSYGVFLEGKGIATRGTFVIDKSGVLRWSVVNSPGQARHTADYEKALASL